MKIIAPVKTWTVKRALLIAGPLATAVLAVISLVWAASAERAADRQQLHQQGRRIDDHETRLRTVEKDTGQTAADVRWIRSTMEKRNGK